MRKKNMTSDYLTTKGLINLQH